MGWPAGRAKVFEFGANVLKDTNFHDRPSTTGAVLNFFVGINAKQVLWERRYRVMLFAQFASDPIVSRDDGTLQILARSWLALHCITGRHQVCTEDYPPGFHW
jgi:hypothetical protein